MRDEFEREEFALDDEEEEGDLGDDLDDEEGEEEGSGGEDE